MGKVQKQFYSNITDAPWPTIIWGDISVHTKYVDPITRKLAEDVKFANDQLSQTSNILTSVPVSRIAKMINKTSLGNIACMAQVHGENSQWMRVYEKFISVLREHTIK